MFIKPHNTPFSLVESFYPHETGKGYQLLLQKKKKIHTLHSWMLLKIHQEIFCKPTNQAWTDENTGRCQKAKSHYSPGWISFVSVWESLFLLHMGESPEM